MKKLGVPSYGKIEADGSIEIETLYGPTHYIADFLLENKPCLKNFENNALNIISHLGKDINIGVSHGNLNVLAPESSLILNEISNTTLKVIFCFIN